MSVVREVTLELRDEGVYVLPGEGETGNLHFGYQDRRAFCVMHEFESTLSERQGDCRPVGGAAAAHG